MISSPKSLDFILVASSPQVFIKVVGVNLANYKGLSHSRKSWLSTVTNQLVFILYQSMI